MGFRGTLSEECSRCQALILTRLRKSNWRVADHQAVTKPRGGVAYIKFTGAVDNTTYRGARAQLLRSSEAEF